MCREAVASGHSGFSDGLNLSILFMLGMVLAVPTGFGLAVWQSYARARRRAAEGETWAPEGRVRWDVEASEEPAPDGPR